jgi:hypothetical protein
MQQRNWQATPEKMQDVFELQPHVMGSDGDWRG